MLAALRSRSAAAPASSGLARLSLHNVLQRCWTCSLSTRMSAHVGGLLTESASFGEQKGWPAMPIQPAALAASIGALHPLDVEHGFARTLQQIVDAAKTLFHADAAGLMLADADGALRWASASDPAAQTIAAGQEQLAQGPCLTAFTQQAPAALRDATLDLVYLELTAVLLAEGIMAGLSVPVEVEGGPIGTLDVYA